MRKLHPKMNPEQRKQFLEANCYVRENKEYNRDLSEEEIETERHFYAENGIHLEDKQKEFDQIKKDYQNKIKEMETLMVERLERIRTRQMKIHGTLYGMRNPERQRMEYYDIYGDMISSRPLTPDEQLGSAFNNEGEPNAEVKGIPFDKHSDIQDADYEEVSEETKELPTPESENEEDVSRETSEEDKPTKGGKGSRKPRKPKDQ